MINQELQDKLEEIVDANSLGRLLEALSQVCYAKADHIEMNWQDRSTSKAWRRAAARVELTSYHVKGQDL